MSSYFGSIGDHFREPRNRRRMEAADFVGVAGSAGLWGTVTLYLRVCDNGVAAAQFQSEGCGYTIACCSLLTEWLIGRSLAECRGLTAQTFAAGIDGIPPHKVHCPQLVVAALHAALAAEVPDRELAE